MVNIREMIEQSGMSGRPDVGDILMSEKDRTKLWQVWSVSGDTIFCHNFDDKKEGKVFVAGVDRVAQVGTVRGTGRA